MSDDIAELSAALSRAESRVTIPPGTTLFRCGDRVSGIFIIHSGQVRMSLDGAASLLPDRELGPPGIVGLPATLTGSYSLSARVMEGAELGFVPVERATELLESSPRLCMLAMRVIGEEVARTRAALREGFSELLQR